MKDTIAEGIHKQRLKRAVAFKHDIDAMVEDIRRHEEISRRQSAKFVTPRKRKKSRAG